MSIIAKKPISIKSDVKIDLDDIKRKISISGKHGDLFFNYSNLLSVTFSDNCIKVDIAQEHTNSSALSGTTRSVINNMVIGVSNGFEKKLLLQGVGYRAEIKEDLLLLSLGYSHQIKKTIPTDLKISIKSNEITVWGIDKQKVGQFSAEIRDLRRPEPYKGKGVRYHDEVVKRKEAKKK